MARRKKGRKSPRPRGRGPFTFQDVFEHAGDPVVKSAMLDFVGGFVRLLQVMQDRTQFTPASPEDRARPTYRPTPDPRRTPIRHLRAGEEPDEEEDE